MHKLPQEEVVQQLVNLLQSELTHSRPVRIPYIGTFRIVHHTSDIREEKDGSLFITPPQDELDFHPEIELSPED